MKKSIWNLSRSNIANSIALNKDINADITVIGAGMAGILTAYLLSRQGANVVVIESGTISGGVTLNTTAKITSQHNLIYDKLISNFGTVKAGQYAFANQLAVKKYRGIIEENNIKCHFEDKSAYVYSLDDNEKIERELKAAEQLGIPAKFAKNTKLPFDVKGSIKFLNQAQFNPIEFIKCIIPDLTIYPNTVAESIEDNIVITSGGNVKSKYIIITTHYPFINSPGYYFMRMHQQRSYVLALENAEQLDGMYIDADEQGYSFRNYEKLLFLGGSQHRTGENKRGGKYEKLCIAAKEFYPDSIEKYRWSAEDCMTLDGIPYIGQYSSAVQNVFVATGFNKWGMTSSMVSAMVISDKILNKVNDFSEVFSPQRFNISASAKNLLKDGTKSAKGLLTQMLKLPDDTINEIENGHGGIVEYDGNKLGVYKNETGEAFIVTTKCPHLGCQLEWNPDELSWDCPCHGSRFDYKGNLLNNPATKGLKNE